MRRHSPIYVLSWSGFRDIAIAHHKTFLPLHDGIRPKRWDSPHCAVSEAELAPHRDKREKEGLGLEFERATDGLPGNFFDTVCAFLNMDGGLIVLGVEDDGTGKSREISGLALVSSGPCFLMPYPR